MEWPATETRPMYLGNHLKGSQKKIFVDKCVWRYLLFPIILYVGLKKAEGIPFAKITKYTHIQIFERKL